VVTVDAMTTIEPARVEDVDSLVELETLLFAEDAGVHDRYADVTWPEREGADDFRRLLENEQAVVLIARDAGVAVGMVVGYTSEPSPTRRAVTVGVLRSMYVRRDARANGVGRQLTEAFLEWARERGCAEARVDSFFDNEAARRLYERAGFKVSNRRVSLTSDRSRNDESVFGLGSPMLVLDPDSPEAPRRSRALKKSEAPAIGSTRLPG